MKVNRKNGSLVCTDRYVPRSFAMNFKTTAHLYFSAFPNLVPKKTKLRILMILLRGTSSFWYLKIPDLNDCIECYKKVAFISGFVIWDGFTNYSCVGRSMFVLPFQLGPTSLYHPALTTFGYLDLVSSHIIISLSHSWLMELGVE